MLSTNPSYKMQNGERGINTFKEFGLHPFLGVRDTAAQLDEFKCTGFN